MAQVTTYGTVEVDAIAGLVADARCVDLRPLSVGRPAPVTELIDLRALPRPRRARALEVSAAATDMVCDWD